MASRSTVWRRGALLGAGLLVLGLACGGSLAPALDVADCFAPVTSNSPPGVGNATLEASFPTLVLHTDVSELIVHGSVLERTVTAELPGLLDEEGPEPAWIGCAARYRIRVSGIAKHVPAGGVPSEIEVSMLEGVAYPEEGLVVEIVPSLSVGQEVVLFLLRAGDTEWYIPVGARLAVEATGGLEPVGEYRGYVRQLGDMTLEDLLAQVRARATEYPHVRDWVDALLTPVPPS